MMTTKTLTTTAMAKMALLTIIVKTTKMIATTTMSMATTIQQPNRSKQLQK